MLQWPHHVETRPGVARQPSRSRVVGGIGAGWEDPPACRAESADCPGCGRRTVEQWTGQRTGDQPAYLAAVARAICRGRSGRFVERCAAPGAAQAHSSEKVEAIVNATLHTTPRDATHWSVRTMAQA